MIKNQINTLAAMAQVDGHVAEKELRFIKMIGKANGLTDDQIEQYVVEPEPMDDFETLTDDEKFEYIYLIIQLMKVDGQVFKSEIVFCEELATQLGYDKKVIGELSTNIYSDPSITADRDLLKKKAQKYLH